MCDKQKVYQCSCITGHKTPKIVLDVNVKLLEEENENELKKNEYYFLGIDNRIVYRYF